MLHEPETSESPSAATSSFAKANTVSAPVCHTTSLGKRSSNRVASPLSSPRRTRRRRRDRRLVRVGPGRVVVARHEEESAFLNCPAARDIAPGFWDGHRSTTRRSALSEERPPGHALDTNRRFAQAVSLIRVHKRRSPDYRALRPGLAGAMGVNGFSSRRALQPPVFGDDAFAGSGSASLGSFLFHLPPAPRQPFTFENESSTSVFEVLRSSCRCTNGGVRLT